MLKRMDLPNTPRTILVDADMLGPDYLGGAHPVQALDAFAAILTELTGLPARALHSAGNAASSRDPDGYARIGDDYPEQAWIDTIERHAKEWPGYWSAQVAGEVTS
jgi:hypothetical protein